MMWQLSANYGIVFAILAGNDYNPIQIKKASSEELAPNRLELRQQLWLVCNHHIHSLSTDAMANISYRARCYAPLNIYSLVCLIRRGPLTGKIATAGTHSDSARAPPVRR